MHEVIGHRESCKAANDHSQRSHCEALFLLQSENTTGARLHSKGDILVISARHEMESSDPFMSWHSPAKCDLTLFICIFDALQLKKAKLRFASYLIL